MEAPGHVPSVPSPKSGTDVSYHNNNNTTSTENTINIGE